MANEGFTKLRNGLYMDNKSKKIGYLQPTGRGGYYVEDLSNIPDKVKRARKYLKSDSIADVEKKYENKIKNAIKNKDLAYRNKQWAKKYYGSLHEEYDRMSKEYYKEADKLARLRARESLDIHKASMTTMKELDKQGMILKEEELQGLKNATRKATANKIDKINNDDIYEIEEKRADNRPKSDNEIETEKNNKITQAIEAGQKTFDPLEFEKWRQQEDPEYTMDDDKARYLYELKGQPRTQIKEANTKKFARKIDKMNNDDDLLEMAWQHHLQEAKKLGITPEELSQRKTEEGLKRDGMLVPIDPYSPKKEAEKIIGSMQKEIPRNLRLNEGDLTDNDKAVLQETMKEFGGSSKTKEDYIKINKDLEDAKKRVHEQYDKDFTDARMTGNKALEESARKAKMEQLADIDRLQKENIAKYKEYSSTDRYYRNMAPDDAIYEYAQDNNISEEEASKQLYGKSYAEATQGDNYDKFAGWELYSDDPRRYEGTLGMSMEEYNEKMQNYGVSPMSEYSDTTGTGYSDRQIKAYKDYLLKTQGTTDESIINAGREPENRVSIEKFAKEQINTKAKIERFKDRKGKSSKKNITYGEYLKKQFGADIDRNDLSEADDDMFYKDYLKYIGK